MSARRSVIIHQTSTFVIHLAETSLYYSAIFVGGDARFGFVSRCRGVEQGRRQKNVQGGRG